MKKSAIAIVLAAVALPSLAISAPADTTGASFGPARQVVRTALRHFLNFRAETPLSEDQRQQVRTILQTHKSEITGLVTRGRDARRAMADSAKAEGPEAAATLKAADQIAAVARDRALMMAKIGSEIRPILTPGQLKRISDARADVEAQVDAAIMDFAAN